MSDEPLNNWRSRRLYACRAADEMERIINALGLEDGSELPPDGGLPTVSENHRNELRNLTALWLRMVLAANDGHVSPSKLQRW
ncbi:hypothetical protein LB559_09010 [Mesorhizobium sp. BR1-1-3]|uniref:hypothetical protein n=1 Tax=Mesorhizobium sp. BR1-1-3 TaxID=2876651 RepID=UPI001CD09072|nr:hypothetical protein [Mesorhizobium sp. BR1-1-3]MBZ9888077.1 hypothetical protein [Mesorhizobium sp. BR1-1-3]